MQLNRSQVLFPEGSAVDNYGRVFFYQGRVFRAIYKDSEIDCRSFLASNLFEILQVRCLIAKTWISEFCFEDCNLVLEHEVIQESKPHHWSFTMFKDAALLVLSINKICNEYGYELKDAHPYNIFFRCNEPVFIDIGSIKKVKTSGSWIAHEEFMNSFYIQLLIWSEGDFFLARKLIEDGNYPLLRTIPMSRILDSFIVNNFISDIFQYNFLIQGRVVYNSNKKNKAIAFVSRVINKVLRIFIQRKKSIIGYRQELKKLEIVEKKIRSITAPSGKSMWGDYHNAYKSGVRIESTARFNRILALISQHMGEMRTAIDLAGNQGVFSYLLSRAQKLDQILLTDYDEKAIDSAYQSFKIEKLNVQPFLFNFMLPMRKEEVAKLKSDIVFALAITHHLLLSQNYSLATVFSRIKEFSLKFVVVEFMPIGLWGGGEVLPVPEWYTVDWFRMEFIQYFELIAEEKLEVNRIVFVGTIKPQA